MAEPLGKTSLPIEDIITPESVDFWPLAIGWWLLLILSFIVMVGLFLIYKKHKKKWGYRKQALYLLEQTFKKWKAKKSSNEDTCHELLTLLKRTAITAYPDQSISSLHGEAWLDLLNSQTPSPLFDKAMRNVIRTQQYQKKVNVDINTLKNICEQWIKQHKSQWKFTVKGEND